MTFPREERGIPSLVSLNGSRLSYKQKLHIKSIPDETYWDRGSAGCAAWNAAREMGNDFDHPALMLIEDAHDKIELLVIVIDPSSS